jgi:hypothetical protein
MREFRPPVRPSVFRLVLAVVLPLIVMVPLGGLLAVTLGMSEASYTLGDGKLVVRSGDLFWGTRAVALSDVTDVRVVALRGGRRTSGTGLPGFCAGHYSYPDLGGVWQVTTCAGRGVLLRAQGQAEPIVLSPPDPDAFVASIRAGTPLSFVLPPPDKGPLLAILMVVAPLGIIGTLMLSALMLFGPGRIRYRVGDGAFEVRTLFGRKRWQTAGARASAYTPSAMIRIAGVGAPGYRTGIFNESGKTTRVYATDTERVVLFEGEARVIVSPEDRVGFLRALEEEGVAIERHA